jgi:hypothetical protein
MQLAPPFQPAESTKKKMPDWNEDEDEEEDEPVK